MQEETNEKLEEVLETLQKDDNYVSHSELPGEDDSTYLIEVKEYLDEELEKEYSLTRTEIDGKKAYHFKAELTLEQEVEKGYKPLEEEVFNEILDVYESGNDQQKDLMLDKIMELNRDNYQITSKQKDKLLKTNIGVSDKNVLLTLLHDKNSEKTMGGYYRKKAEEARKQLEQQKEQAREKGKGLQKFAGGLKEIGRGSQID